MYFGYLKDSATCKRAFQITGKHVDAVIEKPCDMIHLINIKKDSLLFGE